MTFSIKRGPGGNTQRSLKLPWGKKIFLLGQFGLVWYGGVKGEVSECSGTKGKERAID